jgi:hypothetical protein
MIKDLQCILLPACQHSGFFKKILKVLQCNLLSASKADSLNGITESCKMKFTACRAAHPFL